jgi:hypothetical protein
MKQHYHKPCFQAGSLSYDSFLTTTFQAREEPPKIPSNETIHAKRNGINISIIKKTEFSTLSAGSGHSHDGHLNV